MQSVLVELYGLVIRAGLPLPGAARQRSDAPPDLCMILGDPREVCGQVPDGEVMARIERGDGLGSFATLVRRSDGSCTLRCHGVADVCISPDARHVVMHPDPRAQAGLLEVLGAGLVLAVVCILRGHLVLHASAVEHEEACIALVGRSGAGKSTTAALLCRAGARLITDDVLRIEMADPPICFRGGNENRLRPSAASVLGDGGPSRTTADGRLSLVMPRVQRQKVPLRCIVIPYPDRAGSAPRIERVSPTHGLLLLSAFPRVPGWADPATRAEQFRLTAELASRTPVLVATMPWGPPFPEAWSRALLDAVHDQLGG